MEKKIIHKNYKKVAICISGHLRKYEETFYNFIYYIINPLLKHDYSIDIFISTWDELDTKICSSYVHGIVRKNFNKIDVFNVNKLFKPIDIDVENYDNKKHKFHLSNFIDINLLKIEDYLHHNLVPYWIPQYYKFMKVNDLKKRYEIQNNFVYDIVIKTRADLIYKKEINPILFDMEKLFVRDYTHDVFFMSSSSNIDILCDYYNNISKTLNDRKTDIHPEVNLFYYLDKCGMKYSTDYHFAEIYR
jgi:hypothetical protein